ncbi:sugar phosphate nucleotidyltransferase [Thiothrix nivea]|uniref:Nucleotidyl transferase n=1 Tax=Thiothrix nivea (strain ATCC 35100 / DSM 5205 / JP2) TaxID=870187 RepID=A0A656HEU1_THINJ|nr:sugar phosphate nucleotidyltransferase [Thiothrix nivea]EIJ33920.1 Nucleotidyl transferase [Thiothrix nivea DSM 5205]
MKAMILAAGKGTRVRPITHEVAKPMILILRKPVIEYGVVKLDEQQRIVQFQEKPKPEEAVSNTINTDMMLFSNMLSFYGTEAREKEAA